MDDARDDKESLGGVNIQQYIEDLNRADPVLAMPDDFVLVRGQPASQPADSPTLDS